MKKALSLILALVMLFGCLPATTLNVRAAETVQLEPVTRSYTNPLYDSKLSMQPQKYAASVPAYFCETDAEAAEYLRQQMKQRAERVIIEMILPDFDDTLVDRAFDRAVAHTGVPTEGDYLLWQFGGWNCSISGSWDGKHYYLTYDIYISYYTTAQQEAEMDAAVASLLSQLNPDTSNPYNAVKTVYDWMCHNST